MTGRQAFQSPENLYTSRPLLYRFCRACGHRAYILLSGYRTFRRYHGQETLCR